MMCNLQVVNNSAQDISFPVFVSGLRVWRTIGARGRMYLMDAEPTPELIAIDRSKHMNMNFRVVQD